MPLESFPQTPRPALPAGPALMLRALDRSHAEAVFRAVEADREYLRVWLPWVDFSRTVEQSREFLGDTERKRADGVALVYGLFVDDIALAGVISLHDINIVNGKCQVGYWLAQARQGQGLMTRACRTLLPVAYRDLGLERVEICCAVGNEPSRAIPERLGFQFEGILRHAQRLHGGYVDLRLYSLLAAEYRALAEDVERAL